MNKVLLMGRLTADPEVRYMNKSDDPTAYPNQDGNPLAAPMAIGRYTIAVNRAFKRDGEPDADFIRCVAFGRNGDFVNKYLRKGMKIAVVGRIQTGSYTNKDGQKVYTTDVIVEEHHFCESRNADNGTNGSSITENADGFMNIPDGIEEELPFN